MTSAVDPEWATWPVDGRIGVIRCGEAEGQYVLLVAETMQEMWNLYCQPPFETLQHEGLIFCFDNYDFPTPFLHAMLREWCIEWLSTGEDALLEPMVFGLREHWPRAKARRRRALVKRILGRGGRD